MPTERLPFPSIWPSGWLRGLRSHPLPVAILAVPLLFLFAFLYVVMWPLRIARWLVDPIVQRFLRSRFWKWFSSIEIPDPVELYKWDATEAYDLMMRIRKVRPLVLVLLAVEYAAAIVLGTSAGISGLIGAGTWLGRFTFTSVVVLMILGLPTMFVSSYYERLVACWTSFKFTLCPVCAYIRDHSESSRCPDCGLMAPPLSPGELPPVWNAWSGLISPGSVGFPVAVVVTVFGVCGFLSELVGWRYKWFGVLVLVLTASLVALVCCALWRVRKKSRFARHVERMWRLTAEE